jgi:hypothetical protein
VPDARVLGTEAGAPSRPPRRSSMPGLETSGDAPPAATASTARPDMVRHL